MKKFIYSLAVIFLSLSVLPACSTKKDGSRTTRVSRYRSGSYVNNPYVNSYSTSYQQSSQQGQWGVIYNNSNSMNDILNVFMSGISDIGFVSGSQNASTGIRFRGQVSGQSGQIDLMIWDDQANQGMDPFFWTLQVVSVNQSSTTAKVVVEDSVGTVTFNGPLTNSEFKGQVSFDNIYSDGARGTLGSFIIDRCALFICGY